MTNRVATVGGRGSSSRSVLLSLLRWAAGIAGVAGLAMSAQVAHGQVILEFNDATLTGYTGVGSSVQLVQPRHHNRGVNVDGAMRAPSLQGWALAGNPFGEGWDSNNRLDSIRLDTGVYSPTEVDLALPSIGVRWVIGRTYNSRQESGGSLTTSDGYQGKNWMQSSQPELERVEGATDADDVLYIVYGADRYLEFKRHDATSEIYKGKNGTAGVIKRTAGVDEVHPTPDTPEKYEYIDQHGTVTTFFGSTYAVQAAYQLWKIEDSAGNKCYVGDASSMATAISSYNDSGSYPYGAIETAYDSAGRRYTYTYVDYASTFDGISRLTQVKAEINWASTPVTVGQVDYDYYGSTINDVGSAGQLRHVTITTPMTTGSAQVKTKYYRYYTRSYNNSDYRRGHPNGLKMVVDYEGWRRYEGSDGNFGDNDHLTETDNNLKPYAALFLEYESSTSLKRINKAIFNGSCGCAGGANGEYTFAYHDNGAFSGVSGYDEEWATRAVVGEPDGTFLTQYFDETGQPLSRIMTDGDPAAGTPDTWVTEVLRSNSTGSGLVKGCITQIRTPAANDTYTHNTTGNPDGAITAKTGAGLIHSFIRTDSGNLTGFVTDRKWYVGTSAGSKYFEGSTTYTSRDYTGTTPNVVRPLVDLRYEYTEAITSGSSGRNTTDLDYDFHDATSTNLDYLAVAKITTTFPTVTTGNNGSNSATSMIQWFNADGTPSFAKAADAIISYRGYDSASGQVVKSIQDADVTLTAGGQDFNGVTIPGGLSNSGTPLHIKTAYTYDNQGRGVNTTLPNGRVMRSEYVILNDRRMVTLSTPKYEDLATDVYYGPASYGITNHAGGSEAQGVIGFSPSTTTAAASWVTASGNELTCITTGTVKRLAVNIYNNPGNQMTESRRYHALGSFPGSSGTNYDATVYGYDPVGRRWRVKDPTGTIDRTVFDALGRVIEQHLGTNDNGFSGGEVSGTDNMVMTSFMEYDGNADGGNGYLTERTDRIQDSSTGERVTVYMPDDRGRTIVVAGPQSPYTLSKYDNLGRAIATGQYSSTSGLDATDDPTSLATNRIALAQTFYDQKGQVFQSKRHNIDQSDGSDDDHLLTDHWYDAVGRRIKTRGTEVTKVFYDRLGRASHRFIIALVQKNTGSYVEETDYADADDVTDDTVLEEHQTVYEDTTGNVLMQVAILRHVQDSSVGYYGAFDTNADGDRTIITASNVRGRLSITSNWYDSLDRLSYSVAYGTAGITGDATGAGTFNRGSVNQTADDTRLRTDYTYDTAGQVQDVSDPKGTVTRTVYDDAGRTITTIANYINGTPSSTTAADDNHTRYVYTNGLRTKMWVDLDGDNTEDGDDQVTLYVYGVTETPSSPADKYSTINSNRLLMGVKYPDSSNGGSTSTYFYGTSDADVVTYAYNAQGQQVYQKDQGANIIKHEYDTGGRLTARVASTINTGGGYDDRVQRIETTYVPRGMVNLVTQKDGPTSGDDILDQVQYSYDGWGELIKFEQDVDSAIAGGSGRGAFDVEYALTNPAVAGASRVVRRTSMTMPDSTVQTFSYSGSINGPSSRVGSVAVSGDWSVTYYYTGASMVAGTLYGTPVLLDYRFTVTLGDYPDWDRFNRVITSDWYGAPEGPLVAFHDVDITYDRASNITQTVDNLRVDAAGKRRFDALYALDGRYRLTQTDEGEIVTGAIASGDRARQEIWTLDQPGNFLTRKVNANWSSTDTDFSDYTSDLLSDIDDSRAHNNVNEITSWRPDGTNTLSSLGYDAVGNLTDDKHSYKFIYDVFGRLRKINTQGSALVAEYYYNGLGFRTAWHYDVDEDATVENTSDDPWYYFCYDERWRMVATYRGSDSTPKEQFYYHAAGYGGVDGHGSSSYIDNVILRDRDITSGWSGGVDGTLEDRVYYCQNWRADVAGLTNASGEQIETAKYSSYGTPFCLPAGDVDADGDNSGDFAQINTWIGLSQYHERADLNMDGALDSLDSALAFDTDGTAGGRGVLSTEVIGSRKGYAGYENDGAVTRFAHVRHRVLDSGLGRWTRRDPAGYVDGASIVAYTADAPLRHVDSSGLARRTSNKECGKQSDKGSPCSGLCNTNRDVDGMTGPNNICCVCDNNIWDRLQRHGAFPQLPPGKQREGIAPYSIIVFCVEPHEACHIDRPNPNNACGECECYPEETKCLRGQLDGGACGTDPSCGGIIRKRIDIYECHTKNYCAQCVSPGVPNLRCEDW